MHSLAEEPTFTPQPLTLRRESAAPTVLQAMGSPDSVSARAETWTDGRRPDPLAGPRQERRQILSIAQIVCQATVETLAGLRPAQQMSRWLEHEVFVKVRQRSDMMARIRTTSAVQRSSLEFRQVRGWCVGTGAWEVSVVFSDQRRTRACALRFQAHRGKWRVTAMELG